MAVRKLSTSTLSTFRASRVLVAERLGGFVRVFRVQVGRVCTRERCDEITEVFQSRI